MLRRRSPAAQPAIFGLVIVDERGVGDDVADFPHPRVPRSAISCSAGEWTLVGMRTTGQWGVSRAWRYEDVENIGSSGPFQLSIQTLEKGFQFQLKQPITEARYNELWLLIERKHGRIQ